MRYGQRLQIASKIARTHCGMLTAGSSAEKTRFAFRMPLQQPAALTTNRAGSGVTRPIRLPSSLLFCGLSLQSHTVLA
jgi:hypothetical protein